MRTTRFVLSATGSGVEKRAKRLTLDDNIDTSQRLHYGNIASANRVMRYAKARDEIAKAHDILCFEEEAAGLADDFKCIDLFIWRLATGYGERVSYSSGLIMHSGD